MNKEICGCVSLLFLAILSAGDIRERKISIYRVLLFALFAILYRMITNEHLWNEIICCVLPGSALLLLAFLTKESIGYGDGITVLVLGLWTNGRFALAVTCTGIMLSGIWSVVCIFRKKKEAIPFVPFLLLGMEVILIHA